MRLLLATALLGLAIPATAQTWGLVDTLPEGGNVSVYADADHLYAVGTGVLHRSADDGATWEEINRTDFGTSNFVYENVWTDESTPADDLFSFGNGGLSRSLDGGATWTRSSNFGLSNVFDMAKVGDTYYAVTQGALEPGGIFTSADGLAWTQIEGSPSGARDILVDGSTILVSYFSGVTDFGVMRSADGGATWATTLLGDGHQRLVRTPSGVVAGGSGTGTWKRSTDDGVTWTAADPLLFDTIAAAADSSVAALLSGTILTSSDGGATFTDVSDSAPRNGSVTCLTGVAVKAGTVYGSANCPAFTGRGAVQSGIWRLPLVNTSAEDGPAQSAALAVAPNPAAGPALVTLALDAPGAARVEVYDVMGRLVHLLADGAQAAGAQRLYTPTLAPGTYVIRAETETGVSTQRFTVVR